MGGLSVCGLYHDPNYRLGTRGPDQNPSFVAQGMSGPGNAGLQSFMVLPGLKLLGLRRSHIYQDLGIGLKALNLAVLPGIPPFA